MSRLIEHDPLLKITRRFHYNHAEDVVGIETVQDVESVIERTKAQFNMVDERAQFTGRGQFGFKVAEIPLTVLFDLQRKGILYDDDAMKKWLNDKDNRVFRTRPGRV